MVPFDINLDFEGGNKAVCLAIPYGNKGCITASSRGNFYESPTIAFSSYLNGSSRSSTPLLPTNDNDITCYASRRTKPWLQRTKKCLRMLHSKSSISLSDEMTTNEIQMTVDAMRMVKAALQAVDPYVAVRDRIKVERIENRGPYATMEAESGLKLVVKAERDGSRQLTYDLSNYDNIRIFSFGKASAAMALAAAEVLSDALSSSSFSNKEKEISHPKILDGVVIIKDDHATPEEIETLQEKYNIHVRSASHPVPDARSVAGANEILQSASSSDARTLIVACISGGG